MVTKSIERAQKKVEENNFGIRKRLLEYDDVMNIQREAIYKRRRNALSGDRLLVDLNNMFVDLTESVVSAFKARGDFDGFRNESLMVFGVDPEIDAATFKEGSFETVIEPFQKQVMELYYKKREKINELLFPGIKNVHEKEGHRYTRIAIPFTDGRTHPLPVSANIEECVNSEGKTIMTEIEKAVALALIDDSWKEHLRSMDELKDSVQAASFEQKDPLVVYKMEAYNLFEALFDKINHEVCSYLIKGKIILGDGRDLEEARQERTDFSKARTSRENASARAARAAADNVSRNQSKPETFKRQEKKVGRNDLCPCGSGKKYKHCHG
jgi:preprotein translocase subunit SecA